MQHENHESVIAQGAIGELRLIQRVLARGGIQAELRHPPKGQCGS